MTQLKLWVVCGLLHLLTFGATAEDQPKNKTIVIHTPLQNYDQPTLHDYEECQDNRDNCINVCAGKRLCEDECPVCPELYDKPLMVQGINDTNIVDRSQAPINTTNIVRLTNEIHNIIEHQIQNRNEVNVQVQQNVSQVGGRFGLGYTDKGSCCFVVRLDRDCEKVDGRHCREKSRQLVCGEKCQAKVMLARRVVQCDAEDSDQCHETIEFVPRRKKIHQRKSTEATPCQYIGNRWPYFNCRQNPGQNGNFVQPTRVKRNTCQQCLNYPYGYILQYGLQAQCAACFQGYGSPPMYSSPILMYNPYVAYPIINNFPPTNDNNYADNDDTDVDKTNAGSDDEGWNLCDGTQNCPSAEDTIDAQQGSPGHPPVDEDEWDDYNVPAQRRRRRQSPRHFARSSYSTRNRN
ncbi:uncharacterized protein Dere_GG16890 [Drosophila erecta]|nr:uncharacterized protein Dere_GG16890 [Drosophila erecta]